MVSPARNPNSNWHFGKALSNAVVYGNGMDPGKPVLMFAVDVSLGKGVAVIVSEQGRGLDTNAAPDSLAVENLEAEHGRGIYPMKMAMDTVTFERGGTRVRMWKGRHVTKERGCEATTKPFSPIWQPTRGAVVVGTRANPLGRREQAC
jgi:hypothetical protein